MSLRLLPHWRLSGSHGSLHRFFLANNDEQAGQMLIVSQWNTDATAPPQTALSI